MLGKPPPTEPFRAPLPTSSVSSVVVLLGFVVDVDGVLACVAAGGGAALLVARAGLVVDAQVAAQRGLAHELVAGQAVLVDEMGRRLREVGDQAADVRAESRTACACAERNRY